MIYERFYSFIFRMKNKKKFSIRQFVFISIIILFSIPYKMFRLFYLFLISKHNFKTTLEYLCIGLYYKLENSKIE